MSGANYLKILLAVDGSPHSEAAVKLMAGMPWSAGTSAHVLAVVPERWSFLDLDPDSQRLVEESLVNTRQTWWATAETLAGKTAQKLRAGGIRVEGEAREGRPSEVILQRASDLSADLIVIGARGLCAPGEFRMGSTAHKLADDADCSVLIARPLDPGRPPSVILAADGSPESQRAAHFLCTLSLPQWAEVTVVSVAEALVGLEAVDGRLVADVPDFVRRSLLDAAEARIGEVVKSLRGCGAQVRSAIRLGHPAAEILALAEEQDTDMIVLGAHGQTRAGLFRLGGVAQKVVKYASCSVLIVR